MKLNNNYVRQALKRVACNNIENYTILTLANAIKKNKNDNEYISATYAINVMIGELLIPVVKQNNYPYDEKTEIIGLSAKGKSLFLAVQDDVLWEKIYTRSEVLGGISFETLAYCCVYMKNCHSFHQ